MADAGHHGDELGGGVANPGEVRRVGDEVHRPRTRQSAGVQHFLAHIRGQGLSWVPEPLGTDAEWRDVFSYLPGLSALADEAGASSEDLLVDVAAHQRQLHIAAASYVAPVDIAWAASAGAYFPTQARAGTVTPLFCHNDMGPHNVLVTPTAAGPRVSGVIDFDYVAPVDPRFDIAVAARHWIPLATPAAVLLRSGAPSARPRDREMISPAAMRRRFRIFADHHELALADRRAVVELAVAFIAQAVINVAALAAQGRAGFVALIANGYPEQMTQDLIRLTAARDTLTT